jgi:energy-coupling factor transporter transmembrane protein EcfT
LEAFKAAIVALTGAALAIPGMTALGELDLPPEAAGLFPFLLVTFSSAAVLMVFVLRKDFGQWTTRKIVTIAALFLAILMLAFVLFVGLVNKIWVAHTWRPEPSRNFVPLFLPDTAQYLINAAGSRSHLLSSKGPDVLMPFISETNVALTLGVLILCYTVMVTSLASAFTLLYIRASTKQ